MTCFPSLRPTLLGLATLLGAFACGSSSDPTDVLFEPERVIEVAIEMPQASWDALRVQSRGSFFDVFQGADCLSQPFADPFTYFPATVTVDGTTLDNVGVRKKGFFGSLSDTKPSLKIDFGEYAPGQTFDGLDRMTLNNSRQDPSFVKQCMGYDLFARAGIPAPRCNFAHVTVNGAELGLYVHVESVKKDFVARHFADDSGNLYEGTISDFRPEWRGTFEKKTNETDPDQSDIDAVVDALMSNDGQLVAALEPVIDIDQFIDFWAMEVLVAHWDGYAGNNNNFFVYHEPRSGKFHFMPWGTDGILLDRNDNQPKSVFARGELARRLYLLPATRTKYVQRLRDMLASVWSEPALLAEIDRMQALIGPYAETGAAFGQGLTDVRIFVGGRRQAILAELDSGPPVWTEGPRRPFCIVDIGTIDGTFATTFGTLAAPDPFVTGSGAYNATINNNTLVSLRTGAKSGFEPNQPPGTQTQVQLVSQTSATDYWVFAFNVQADWFGPGTLGLDFDVAIGYAAHFDSVTQEFTLVGYISQGTLTFVQAAAVDGAPVSGTFAGVVIEPF